MHALSHYRVRLRRSQRLRYRIAWLLVSPLALMALAQKIQETASRQILASRGVPRS
jgi:hypothetical protein